jgi:hypothetical protein
VNIHQQLSAPAVAQVWLVTVVMFAKTLIAIVVLIVLLLGWYGSITNAESTNGDVIE